jgi:hypothetical protein
MWEIILLHRSAYVFQLERTGSVPEMCFESVIPNWCCTLHSYAGFCSTYRVVYFLLASLCPHSTVLFRYISCRGIMLPHCRCLWSGWIIIVGFRFDDWIYWKSVLQLHLITTVHTFNYFLIMNLSLLSGFCTGVQPLGFYLNPLRVRVRVTSRLAVCRASVGLGDKPLETHDH